MNFVLIWGGGDLASGVAIRLYRAGIRVLVIEHPQPKAVRRSVSFAQAVFDGDMQVEDVIGQLVDTPGAAKEVWVSGQIPVIVDPDLDILENMLPLVLVDARMQKKYSPLSMDSAPLVVGLGPGFVAGENCHAAIETNRGHFLGRVVWMGSPEEDTGVPGRVQSYTKERVLYAPASGVVRTLAEICDLIEAGTPILSVNGKVVEAPFSGVLRGLIHDGIQVEKGMKVGDIDPRPETFRCRFVSEKSLAIGGGVLEALLTREDIRRGLWKG